MTNAILADHPAVKIHSLAEGHNIELTDDKGYARTGPVALYIRAFPGDRYEFIRSFTIGCDGDDPSNVWAFANTSVLSDSPSDKRAAVGCELGDTIHIEGGDYRVDPASNKNITLTAV